jgi:hypothetical protein
MYNMFTLDSFEEGVFFFVFFCLFYEKQVLSWNNTNPNYIRSISVNVDLKKQNLMYIS